MKSAVIYARYSSDRQTEQSIEGQLRVCREYAKREGYTILGEYIDRALTGRTDQRPDFQRMIADSKSGAWNAVIVYKLDRFSRDKYDAVIYKRKLRQNGVRVISAMENIADSPEGVLTESLLEGMAEYYSKDLSQKTLRGLRESAYKCQTTGPMPLGYETGPSKEYVINEAEAPIVRITFSRYASGDTMDGIAEHLNRSGYRTRKGVQFRVTTVHNILTNPKYTGLYVYQDIVIADGIPALVDQETWKAVQDRMRANKKAPARAKAKIEYLLSGKVYCGTCKTSMIGESGTGRGKLTYAYYKCGARKRGEGCDKKPVRKEVLERRVVQATLQQVLQPDIIKRMAHNAAELMRKARADDTELKALQAQYRETVSAYNNLMVAIEQAPLPGLLERARQHEEKKAQLENAIAEQKTQTPLISEEDMAKWISRFANGSVDDMDYCRKVIDTFVTKVYVYDDKLIITYNYSGDDRTKDVSIEDIEAELNVSDLTPNGEPKKDYPNTELEPRCGTNGFWIIVRLPER